MTISNYNQYNLKKINTSNVFFAVNEHSINPKTGFSEEEIGKLKGCLLAAALNEWRKKCTLCINSTACWKYILSVINLVHSKAIYVYKSMSTVENSWLFLNENDEWISITWFIFSHGKFVFLKTIFLSRNAAFFAWWK